jgi:TolA-binding protein
MTKEAVEKKGVSRTVAIALGIICIVLAVGLVGAVALYSSQINDKDNTITTENSQLADKDSQISNLQTWLNGNKTLLAGTIIWLNPNKTLLSQTQTHLQGNLTEITSLNSQIASLQSQISYLNSQVTSLQNQISNLNAILNLQDSTIWVNSQTISQPASSYSELGATADYAGYVWVNVQSSTTTNTYVEVIWSAYGVSYDNTITVGTSGTACFPILPTWIEVRIGNTNLVNGASETVTITYYY